MVKICGCLCVRPCLRGDAPRSSSKIWILLCFWEPVGWAGAGPPLINRDFRYIWFDYNVIQSPVWFTNKPSYTVEGNSTGPLCGPKKAKCWTQKVKPWGKPSICCSVVNVWGRQSLPVKTTGTNQCLVSAVERCACLFPIYLLLGCWPQLLLSSRLSGLESCVRCTVLSTLCYLMLNQTHKS